VPDPSFADIESKLLLASSGFSGGYWNSLGAFYTTSPTSTKPNNSDFSLAELLG
jgi:hypothetical protein